MIKAGEDPLFIARRLMILATEDIGLANPNAFLMASACFDAVHRIGMPEGRIPLAQTAIYLATSAKSNSAYAAIGKALEAVEKTGDLSVPLHLRNAPTKLMKELGYAKDYKYAHDFEKHFVDQEFLPKETSFLLKQMGVDEDFKSSNGKIRYTHKKLKDADIYFIANRTDDTFQTKCSFRVEEGAIELWNPLTGEIRELPHIYKRKQPYLYSINF